MFVESEGDVYAVAALSWPAHAQYCSDVAFTDQDIKVLVKGKGEVRHTFFFSCLFLSSLTLV